MTRRIAAIVAGAALAFSLFAGLASGGIGASGPPDTASLGRVGLVQVAALAMTAVGALLMIRRTSNAVGWLFCGYGVLFSTTLLSEAYAARSLLDTVPQAGGAVAGWLATWVWAIGLVLLALALLLFPDGRLPSQRWRWLPRLAVLDAALWLVVAGLLWPHRSPGLYQLALTGGHPGHARIYAWVGAPLVFATFGAAAVSVVIRFRHSRGDERQQVKWLLFAAAVVVAGMILAAVTRTSPGVDAPPAVELVLAVGILGMPLAIAVAILKYRLYDIDRIISRTVSYGALTGVLGGAYAVGVVVLGQLLSPLGAGSDLAVAGSTLGVAALFGPLRRRVQALVDRRFNRARYDAERTVEAFRGRLRNEVDLDQLSAELLTVVRRSVEPDRASLWLRSGSRNAAVTAGSLTPGQPR